MLSDQEDRLTTVNRLFQRNGAAKEKALVAICIIKIGFNGYNPFMLIVLCKCAVFVGMTSNACFYIACTCNIMLYRLILLL